MLHSNRCIVSSALSSHNLIYCVYAFVIMLTLLFLLLFTLHLQSTLSWTGEDSHPIPAEAHTERIPTRWP